MLTFTVYEPLAVASYRLSEDENIAVELPFLYHEYDADDTAGSAVRVTRLPEHNDELPVITGASGNLSSTLRPSLGSEGQPCGGVTVTEYSPAEVTLYKIEFAPTIGCPFLYH